LLLRTSVNGAITEYSSPDIASLCSFDLSRLRNANGQVRCQSRLLCTVTLLNLLQPLVPTATNVRFVPYNIPAECNYHELVDAVDSIRRLIDDLSSVEDLLQMSQTLASISTLLLLLLNIFAFDVPAGAWDNWDPFTGCRKWVDTFLIYDNLTTGYIRNTIKCASAPGSPAYLTDPCCNPE
jgi:hypothetical protein